MEKNGAVEECSSSCSPPGSPTVLLKSDKKSPRPAHHNMEFRIEVLEWARSGSGPANAAAAGKEKLEFEGNSASNPSVIGNIIEDIDLSAAEPSPKSANKVEPADSKAKERPKTLEDLSHKEVRALQIYRSSSIS